MNITNVVTVHRKIDLCLVSQSRNTVHNFITRHVLVNDQSIKKFFLNHSNLFVILQRKIPTRHWSKSCHVTLTNTHCCPRTVDWVTLKSSTFFVIVYFLTCTIVWFWDITKQIVTGVSIIIANFIFLVYKMLSSISGNISRTSGIKFSIRTSTPVTICIVANLRRNAHNVAASMIVLF